MLKLLQTWSFEKQKGFEDEPDISVIDLSSALEKKASHEAMAEFISKLRAKEGFTYLHINAMTAGEYHGSNRNADFFPEENLKRCYKTFETGPAHVFRHHINKDPKRAYGKVIFAMYNDRMHRIELIAECPNELVDDINSRIAMGDYPTTSMACKTPYDTCSICGSRATSRDAYCDHLKSELNKLYPDGRKVFAINDGPLHFFDISIVIRPADVTSSILQKVAYDQSIGSAELAEIEGISESIVKKASLKKLSELIKDIEDSGYVDVAAKDPMNLLSQVQDLPLELIDKLCYFDIPQVLTALADLGISPSLEFLAELIARKHLGEGYRGIGELAAGMIKEAEEDTPVPVFEYTDPENVNPNIYTALYKCASASSLLPAFIEKRAIDYSSVGYAGLGPMVEPLQSELNQPRQEPGLFNTSSGYGKMILTLGAAALLAKWYITRQIEKRITSQNQAKIILVKQASDYALAYDLAKKDLNSSLPKKDKADTSNHRTVISIIRRMLEDTKGKIGGRLSKILHIGNYGLKAHDAVQNNILKGN